MQAAMWDLVDKCGITVFGTSAKWIDVQVTLNCDQYRVTLVVEYLGWVRLDLESSPAGGQLYCSYLMP